MARQPTWTWRFRAKADDKWYRRQWYGLLRTCCDTGTVFDRLVNAAGLTITLWYLVVYLWSLFSTTDSGQPSAPVFLRALVVIAIFLAIKGLMAHATRWLLRDQTIIAGADTSYRLDNLVPLTARRVAVVGQNLASRLDERFETTRQGIQALLSRQRSGTATVEEIWLVLQTPLALLSVHPDAARHLCSVTIPGLERLAELLKDSRVKVAFHPAATLSMIVVDWDRDSRFAIVGPKMQTILIIDRRLSVVLAGSAIDSVAPHFDRFLSEASRAEFPGACVTSLSDAASKLRDLFRLSVVQGVEQYVQEEENRVRRNRCINAG